MNLDDNSITSFGRCKTIEEAKIIHTFDYHHTGNNIVYSCSDTIKVFNCINGKTSNIVHCNVLNLKTLFDNLILTSSENIINLHSLYDNHIVRQFKEHDKPIKYIDSHKQSDTFISLSDNKLVVHDLRVANSIYNLEIDDMLVSMSDNKMAIIINNSILNLYDIRFFNGKIVEDEVGLRAGPYYTKLFDEHIENIKGYNDVFVVGANNSLQFIDEKHENKKIYVDGRNNYELTPDGKYCFVETNNTFQVMDVDTCNYKWTYRGGGNIVFNPCYAQFVTVDCTVLTFWMLESTS